MGSKGLSTRDDTDEISNLFVKIKLSLFAILVENHLQGIKLS